ncbi:hypothetical protein PV646_31050 [Streptomyces sp. ID05-26A]|nr:hypothetical protein [Streptomyces sp. ID05-26A]
MAVELPTLVALKQADHCFDLVWGSLPAQTARFAIMRFLNHALPVQ